MNSSGRLASNLRALRLLASRIYERDPIQQLAAAVATHMHSSMPSIPTSHHLITSTTNSTPSSTRPFASSTATQQAEPAMSTETSTQEPIDPLSIPVFLPLNEQVQGPYTIQPKKVFAVVEVGGTQYKVTPDDLIYTEKLSGIDIHDKLRLSRVLLLGSTAETVIGRPFVLGASVIAAVEEQTLDGKVLIFKKRRRKNSRRMQGHRQPLTGLRILDIEGIEEAS